MSLSRAEFIEMASKIAEPIMNAKITGRVPISIKPEIATFTTEVEGVKLRGRAALSFAEFPEWIAKYLDECEDYVEIGTMFGGTAVLAGLHVSGDVYCIDPLNGYYKSGWADKHTKLVPSPEIVEENWNRAGLDPDRLHIYNQKHPPWPELLRDARFDIGYIDGDHTEEGATADWNELKTRVNKYIVFDNLEKPEVMRAYSHARMEWKEVEFKEAYCYSNDTVPMAVGVLKNPDA